ncbi:MAG: hypothetical protein H8E68_09260 [Kiritimatiellaeota bacterium]|nr:hypothetical protein [Kiritimatiellota bacterium]
MRRSAAHLILAVCLFAGLTASPVLADLGLQQIFSSEALPEDGLERVGATVKAAVEGIYGSTEDREQISNQITAILDEAALTGNAEIVRYTIVAVMLAGGADNLDLSKEAIDNSRAFADFPAVTALTVSAAKDLLSAMSDSPTTDGNGDQGGGNGDQGGGNGDQGGGNGDQGGGNGDQGGGNGDQGGGNGDQGGGDGDDEQGGDDGDDEQGGGDDENPLDDDGDADIDDDDIPGTPV